MTAHKTHSRYHSLKARDAIVKGVNEGVTSKHGLIAHGRGEAFDYLLGEKTKTFAKKAIDASCAMLLLAKHPVLSINGNVVALVRREIVKLSKLTGAKIEVNIYHASKRREQAIKKALMKAGAKEVLMPSKTHKIKYIDYNRKWVNPKGIFKADVIFVPLEDGDRCQALVKDKRKVITVDLNPLSRTAKTSTITIVDNVVRVLPLMNKRIPILKKKSEKELKKILSDYNNKKVLKEAEKCMRSS